MVTKYILLRWGNDKTETYVKKNPRIVYQTENKSIIIPYKGSASLHFDC